MHQAYNRHNTGNNQVDKTAKIQELFVKQPLNAL